MDGFGKKRFDFVKVRKGSRKKGENIVDSYLTGKTIKALRESKGLTQQQLAKQLFVSEKTVSKWETGKGLPDVSLLAPLSKGLGVNLAYLLGEKGAINTNKCGNIRKLRFYFCPICNNLAYSLGEATVSCCGIDLPALQAEEASGSHFADVQIVDGDYFVTFAHPMTKTHYVSFVALVTFDGVTVVKLYPEQNAELRLPRRYDGGTLYFLCNQEGLFNQTV